MIKKGELTTQQIVILIILIVSFSVLLVFIWQLNPGEVSAQEACRNSVVLKAESPTKTGNLDCNTAYVCISGGGECEGISPTVTKTIDPTSKNELLDAITQEMVNCWWMFGEGKLAFLPLTNLGGYHCAVCSTVKFDKTLQDKYKTSGVTYADLYTYLQTNNYDNSQTYLKYLFDEFVAQDFVKQSAYLSSNYNNLLNLTENFVVITGRNNDVNFLGIQKDKIIPSYFIPSKDLGQTPCDGDKFDLTKG